VVIQSSQEQYRVWQLKSQLTTTKAEESILNKRIQANIYIAQSQVLLLGIFIKHS